jgi:cytochrome c oxidase assembly protein subunit 15
MGAARWIGSFALAAVVLCLAVVLLGAYVRLNDAGLGCPDWPGCYGHLAPPEAVTELDVGAYRNRPLEPGKAWREMIHRYAAATLATLIVMISVLTVAARRRSNLTLALALLGVVAVQALLGMLTVTWQLKPLVVTLHLLFGMLTLGLLWWLVLSQSRRAGSAQRRAPAAASVAVIREAGSDSWCRRLTLVALAALVLQITLGGWTSSNYAAIACPDLPRCQASWWPTTDFHEAFALRGGEGINYEGGVLENPARTAIHLTHRLGALATSVTLVLAAGCAVRRRNRLRVRVSALGVLAALLLQLLIASSMVLKGFPLWLATAHTAGAALLLLAVLALLRSQSPARSTCEGAPPSLEAGRARLLTGAPCPRAAGYHRFRALEEARSSRR